MKNRSYPQAIESMATPEPFVRQSFDDARKAVATLRTLYARNTRFLRDSFAALAAGGDSNRRYRAFYPEISVSTNSFTQVDSRQAYGHRSEEHTSELQSRQYLVCRLLLEKKKQTRDQSTCTAMS